MLPEEVRGGLDWVAEGVAVVPPSEGSGGTTSLLIEDGDVLLVDAGLDADRLRRLAPHVDVCILTHCHVPYGRGAHLLGNVWAPREEARALASVEEYLAVYGVAPRDRDAVGGALKAAGYAPAEVHKTYRAGGLLKLREHEWQLLSAPGHSPGLTLLLDPKRHILFASGLDDAPGSPWYGYPDSDPEELEKTLQELSRVDVAILVTSHAPPRRRGIRQMFRSLAERIRERDRAVLQALDKPRSVEDLVKLAPVQGQVSTPLEAYHERVMVHKHLGRLMARDFAVARQDGRYERAI